MRGVDEGVGWVGAGEIGGLAFDSVVDQVGWPHHAEIAMGVWKYQWMRGGPRLAEQTAESKCAWKT